MIVGHPVCANKVPGFSKTISWTKDFVVILAITFCNGTGNESNVVQIEVRRLSSLDASVPVFLDAWLHPLAVTQGPVHKSSKETQNKTCHLQCDATHGTLDTSTHFPCQLEWFFCRSS